MKTMKKRGRIMIIGAGGVATVAVHKCAQVPEVFTEVLVASRTLSKCEAIKKDIEQRYGRDLRTAQVDADDVTALTALIGNFSRMSSLILPFPIKICTSWMPAWRRVWIT